MKRLFFLVLVISITSDSYAQYQPNSEDVFEVPVAKIKRKFLIELARHDKMQIELTDIKGLQYVRNVDSLVALFLRDLRPLKDSLKEGIFSRRIDYIVDTSSTKKIRIQKFYPSGSHFVVINGKTSLLKLEQDTITIMGKVKTKLKGGMFGYYEGYSYYRISFFLNNLNDLTSYVDGRMNEKVKFLEKNVNTIWAYKAPAGVYLKKDPDISAAAFRGLPEKSQSFAFRVGLNIQNYRNYFVPSASYGFVFIKPNNIVRHKFGLQYESHFRFSERDSASSKLYVNGFITFLYERENIMTGDLNGFARLTPIFSFGYLIRRQGDFYEKNTFKIGLGRYAPFSGKLQIEPVFYCDNVLKRISPSLRVTQYF
ncbi:MAG: hypothetical protein ABIN36_16760 [Ferruginibacter sp.]